MKELLISDRPDILVLDDQPETLHLMVHLLSAEYSVHPFGSAAALFRYLDEGHPADLILLDAVMPPPDGYEVCRRLRERVELADVPIVFLTGLDSADDEARGLELGAVDFISKPFSPPILLARVRNHLQLGRALRLIHEQNELLDRRVADRTAALVARNRELQAALTELGTTQDGLILAMTAMAETRDNETGLHVVRTQSYVRELALTLRAHPKYAAVLDDATIDSFYKSAPLHDIGKVAIPDHILRKPGKLTREEYEVMKTHPAHGQKVVLMAESVLASSNSFLRHAREIAYSHHERWDGTGYPQGLEGEQIPLSARLMALSDVYDALICRRAYKAPMSHEEATRHIIDGRGTHFDPDVVDAFLVAQDRFIEISREHHPVQEWSDAPEGNA